MIAICLFVIAISSISASAFDMRADEAQFDTKRKVYHLAGNVTAKLNGKTFIADKIVIYMNENGKDAKRVIATGNVCYRDKKISVTAKSCESNMFLVTFLKDVVIEGKDYGILKADRIVYQFKSGIVNITSKNRVKFILDNGIESKLIKKK